MCQLVTVSYVGSLEDTARYTDLLLAPAEHFGRGIFCPLGKKNLIMLFWPIFGNFWCPVVTLVTFNSNLSKFERNHKKTKESKKVPNFFYKFQTNPKKNPLKKLKLSKIVKKSKNLGKSEKKLKNLFFKNFENFFIFFFRRKKCYFLNFAN